MCKCENWDSCEGKMVTYDGFSEIISFRKYDFTDSDACGLIFTFSHFHIFQFSDYLLLLYAALDPLESIFPSYEHWNCYAC
jgi:hypothetical protein